MALGVGHLSRRELITAEAGFEWTQTHFYFGYGALALVLFRLIWVYLAHCTHAMSPLLFCLWVCFAISKISALTIFRRSQPLGGWASVLIVSLIGLQAASGLFISDDIFYAGPYNSVVSSRTADALASWHHRFFTLIQIALVLHLAAVSWHTWGLKERLIEAMFHEKNISLAALMARRLPSTEH